MYERKEHSMDGRALEFGGWLPTRTFKVAAGVTWIRTSAVASTRMHHLNATRQECCTITRIEGMASGHVD